jgi:hypothetical protein
MKRLWASLIIATMMLSIFSLSSKPILRAETKNKQGMNAAIKWNLCYEDELGNAMETWRAVPWQPTPDAEWFGREGYLMPNAQLAKHSSFIQRNIPATTRNGYFTRPVMWARFYMDITADKGLSQGTDLWYVILDDAGQMWFDPDGFFHDPRYDETADPGRPGETIPYPTDIYTPGSCRVNTHARIDPIPGSNTQGPYILDPFYQYNTRDPNPSYQANIFFWDNRPGDLGTNRYWKLGWASFTDFQNNSRVQATDWDTGIGLIPFRSDEYFVDLEYTFEGMPRLAEWDSLYNNYNTITGRYDYGEFIYRKGSGNTSQIIQEGDLRLSPVVCYDPLSQKNVTYEPNTYVNLDDLDFIAQYTFNSFTMEQHTNYGGQVGYYHHHDFIYVKGSRYDSEGNVLINTARVVEEGDIRLTPVDKHASIHSFLRGKNQWWGGLWKNDIFLLAEVLEGGCNAPTYDIHVQSDVWMNVQPSISSVRLRSPSQSVHLPAQSIQKNTSLLPNNAKYPLPVTTFHHVKLTHSEFLGMELWKDNGTNNVFLTQLNIQNRSQRNNLSDDYIESEQSEHYIGAENNSLDLDYNRNLQAFSADIRFHDANGDWILGTNEPIYKKGYNNLNIWSVQEGDIRYSEVKYDIAGQRFEYKPNTIVRNGDPDFGLMLGTIPSNTRYYPSMHAFAGLDELIEYKPGDDIYTRGAVTYSPGTVTIRALGDAWQYLYADIDLDGRVSIGDIRIFSINPNYLNGSVVAIGDADINLVYRTLPLGGLNVSMGTDENDQFAYADINANGLVDPGDIRLTQAQSYRPGSVVAIDDSDYKKANPTPPPAFLPKSFLPYDVRSTPAQELFLDLAPLGAYNFTDVALTPSVLRSGLIRLTNVKINDIEYLHGTRVSAGNVYYQSTYIHMIPTGLSGDKKYMDMAILPANMGLDVKISAELTVERTTQIDVEINPPPKAGEKVYLYVFDPDAQESSNNLVNTAILSNTNQRLSFQYTPYRGSVGFSGHALERYFRVQAFKVAEISKEFERNNQSASLKKPYTGTYQDPFWATQKVLKGPIHFEAQIEFTVPKVLPRIFTHMPNFSAFYNGYDCYEQWKKPILPAQVNMLPNKKALTIYEERQPVMEIQVFDGDDPLDVNDPFAIPLSTITALEDEPFAYYNAHGAGIAYLFTTYLSLIADGVISDPSPDGRRAIEGWRKAIIQVNVDNSFHVWEWHDVGHLDRFDGPDFLSYFGRGVGNFLDQDCSFGSGKYDLETGSLQKPPPLGNITRMDTFAGAPIIHYGVPVKLTNFYEKDPGARFLVCAKPVDSSTPLNIVFYSHQMIFDYNSRLAYPRYGGQQFHGPYFISDFSGGIDYIGSVQIKVCDPDPTLNFVDISWVDHALQYSKIDYTGGANALSPLLSPPTPYIRSRYNPVLYDWQDDIRSYPGGQTHTGRVQGTTGTTETGRGSGWNAYPAIWSKNTARIALGASYDSQHDYKYNQFNKLGTEFYPLTDYSLYFLLKNFNNLNYTFETSPPNIAALERNNLSINRITIRGPFMRPRPFYDYESNTISYTLPNKLGDLSKVPIQYDYSGEIVITNQNYQLFEFDLGETNFTSVTSPPTSQALIGSETVVYHPENPMRYNLADVNPILQYNRAIDYTRASFEQQTYDNAMFNAFCIDEIIPIGRGRITIEVELANGTIKSYEDCCTGDFKEGGFLVHGLDVQTDKMTLEPDRDHRVDVKVMEYEPKGYDPRYTDTVHECNNAVLVAWQDRGIKDASGRIIGAGDGWITRPPTNSITSSRAYQFDRDHDVTGDGKVSFADYETEIIGTYDLASNTWYGGIIDGRTYNQNNGTYSLEFSHNRGNQINTVGYDFGGGKKIGQYSLFDHIVDSNEMLPINITAYKYGDDNNDRANTPFYDYYDPDQYSHEVYLAGQTAIQVVPSNTLNITTVPDVLTAGTAAELNDPQNPLSFVVLDEEGNAVDLSAGGIADASGNNSIDDDSIWTKLILDPLPDNKSFYGTNARLPQYYWIRTDLHNVDNSKINNSRLYSSNQNPFYPIETDFRDKTNGRYIFKGFVANDQGSFDVFVFTPDRKRFGKVAVKVALPQVSYEVVNADDPQGQSFTSPGDPDFVLTAGDNRLYRITAHVKTPQGIPLKGAGNEASVCGGTANETARFTLLTDTPKNFGWQVPTLAYFTNSAIPNRTYNMIAGKTAGYSAFAHLRGGFDYNKNGTLDESNREIFEIGGFKAYRYDYRVATGNKFQDGGGAYYTYYNTRSWMWDNGDTITYPLHYIFPEDVINYQEQRFYPNLSFEKGMGLGAIYNSPHKGGYTFADLDRDQHLTYKDSFNLDSEGKTTFYLFAEDIASIGGLIGNNRYSINDAYSDVAGNGAAYASSRDPQNAEYRFFNQLLFRRVLLACPYQIYCDLYGYEYYCTYCRDTWPNNPYAWITESSTKRSGDNTYRLDWDAMPSHYLDLKAPSVDMYDAKTGVSLGKEILSPDSYDIAYGKTNSILIRAYPADRRDLPLQVGSSLMVDTDQYYPLSFVEKGIYGPQSETAIFGNLYTSSTDPKARETLISFTPTGIGMDQAYLQYWNRNTRFNYPPFYMVGGSASFDIAQGLELEVFESEPLKAKTPGKITVIVKEAGTTMPVRGAKITVEGLGVSDTKTADSKGTAVFSLTPNNRGVLVVKAMMEGMITATYLQGVDEDVSPQYIDLDPVDILPESQEIIISGRVKVGSVLTINQAPVKVDEFGKFRYEAKLTEQNTMFEIIAKDPSGKIAKRIINVERPTDELQIQMDVPEKYIDVKEASIRGKVLRTKVTEETPSRLIWIFVNGVEAQVVPDEKHLEFTFEATVPLNYGSNRIEVNVRTAEGFTKKVTQINNYRKTTIELQIDNDKALINGQFKTIDGKPYISGGRTYVPLRVIAEGFGAEVTWVQQSKGINITLGDKVISMQIGSTKAMVNNEMVLMDAPPEIKDGRTFVPIRFVSEMLGAEVEWIQSTRTVKINRLTLD